MKKLIALLVLILVLALFSGIVVQAEDGYTIPAVRFDIQTQYDGSLLVTEHWTLSYSSDGYSRFLRELDSEANPAEYSVLIDGLQCEQTSDFEARPDYHFAVSQEYPITTVSVFLHASANTLHTYTINYRLPAAIELDDEGFLLSLPLLYGNTPVKPQKVYATLNYSEVYKPVINGITAGHVGIDPGKIVYTINESMDRFGIYVTLYE